MGEALAVCAGVTENVPQLPPLPVQVAVQSTPAFVLSPVTVAAMFAAPEVCIEVGGVRAGVKEIAMPAEGETVMTAVTCCEGSAVEAAMMVINWPPAGTVLGAVNVAALPLSVCIGLMEPQFDEPEQVTLQVTPLPELSPVTWATTGSDDPACRF